MQKERAVVGTMNDGCSISHCHLRSDSYSMLTMTQSCTATPYKSKMVSLQSPLLPTPRPLCNPLRWASLPISTTLLTLTRLLLTASSNLPCLAIWSLLSSSFFPVESLPTHVTCRGRCAAPSGPGDRAPPAPSSGALKLVVVRMRPGVPKRPDVPPLRGHVLDELPDVGSRPLPDQRPPAVHDALQVPELMPRRRSRAHQTHRRHRRRRRCRRTVAKEVRREQSRRGGVSQWRSR